jgi:hypothetical protein
VTRLGNLHYSFDSLKIFCYLSAGLLTVYNGGWKMPSISSENVLDVERKKTQS